MPDSRASEPQAGRRDALLSLDELQTAVRILDGLGVDWAVVGGQVANLYRSDVRLTRDYDFLVGSFDGLRSALKEAGFEIEIGDAESHDVWLIRASRDGVPYDFSLAEVDYQVEAIDRARANGGVLAVEDVLIQKLLAWRFDDQRDIDSILEAGVGFDSALVRRWCDAFEITDRLDEKLRRAAENA